jgi:Na+/H+ antiporter NhaC
MPSSGLRQSAPGFWRRRSWIVVGLLVVGGAAAAGAPAPQTTQTAISAASASAPSPVEPKDFYGLWAIAPPVVAIILAILTRQAIIALAIGVLTAASMICVMQGTHDPLHFITFAMDRYVLGSLVPSSPGGGADLEHITIILYTLFIGAMIGVSHANGGTRALVARVTRRVRTRRSGQLSTIAAGLLIFFDDYASAMIVGLGLRPIYDRLKISREKLAYLVNWTAAPDSSIFLGTWLAVQISYIDSGFKMLGDGVPAFLSGTNAANTFWATIPYRTYTLLALVMATLVALTGRDFGGMKKAERRAADTDGLQDAATLPVAGTQSADPNTATAATEPRPPDDPLTRRWLLGAAPALLIVLMTVLLMAWTGWQRALGDGTSLAFDSGSTAWSSVATILAKADSHHALLYASLSAAVLAILMSVASRGLSLAKTMEGATAGMSAMFTATIILVLAWGLAAGGKDLQLGLVAREFLAEQIEIGRFSITWLPLSIFLTACLISFSTGTTWGTMAILCPPVVTIAANLLADLPRDQALSMFYYCVGSAMAGAVFGNTCSPLADVTVLSSIFTGCDLYAHVRTTLPYALTAAFVSVVATDGARYALQRWRPDFYADYWCSYHGLALGALLLLLILIVIGRRQPRALSP